MKEKRTIYKFLVWFRMKIDDYLTRHYETKPIDIYTDGIYRDGKKKRITISFATLLMAGPGKAEKILQDAKKGKYGSQ